MASITVTPADVRPLQGAQTIRAIVNEVMNVGDSVYVDGYSGDLPTIKMTAAAVLATGNPLGLVVSGPVDRPGVTLLAVGDVVDVQIGGRMAGCSGGTAGGFVWASDTAGDIADAVGTKSSIIGEMLTPAILLIRPSQTVRSA